ncbi:hypothetical protein [Burkholderia glumae]|uniref:hypothetical protein n=1 Tax=Burkholderia glumae TaxID=337 RepID=UPI0012D2EA24|nr:hypothetical protein [Burkholderia glumae]
MTGAGGARRPIPLTLALALTLALTLALALALALAARRPGPGDENRKKLPPARLRDDTDSSLPACLPISLSSGKRTTRFVVETLLRARDLAIARGPGGRRESDCLANTGRQVSFENAYDHKDDATKR